MKYKFLYIASIEKFISPYIEFIQDNFNFNEYLFILIGSEKLLDKYNYNMKKNYPNVEFIYDKFTGIKKLPFIIKYMNSVNKIILHGLWWYEIISIFFINLWLINKVFWIMWGEDFYFPEKQSKLKRKLISKIKHFITYLEEYYEYVKRHYKSNGTYHECIADLSNVVNLNKSFNSLSNKKREKNRYTCR